jgi:RHS repeat-associated protein
MKKRVPSKLVLVRKIAFIVFILGLLNLFSVTPSWADPLDCPGGSWQVIENSGYYLIYPASMQVGALLYSNTWCSAYVDSWYNCADHCTCCQYCIGSPTYVHTQQSTDGIWIDCCPTTSSVSIWKCPDVGPAPGYASAPGAPGAGSGDGPGGGDGGCKGGTCCSASGGGTNDGPKVGGFAGDPVDLATGFFLYSKQDLYVPGVIPISISRYYRAGATNLGAFGVGTYFEYDWWMGIYQNTMTLVKPGNYQYKFSWQTNGTYVNTTDPAMRGAVATVNADNSILLYMKDGWIYTFDPSGKLIRIADRNGNALTIQRRPYAENGFLQTITTPEGRWMTFNQTFTGNFYRTDSITDSAGRTVSYSYETDPFSDYPRLKTVTYPDGSTIQYNYDSSGRMSEIINEKGAREVLNEYDENNRVIRQTHADGGVYSFSYTLNGGVIAQTSMTAPNGGTTSWLFNSAAYITDITTPDGETTYEREPGTDKILSITDPLGRTVNYVYDAMGRVSSRTDNADNTTSYEYEDTFSGLTKITDALGHITSMTYDAFGNLASRTEPDDKTTTFTYNSLGKPLNVTDAAGNTVTMQYDTMGNLTGVTDPLGHSSSMAYDSLGRMTTFTDAKGNSAQYGYDVMGRILSVTDPLGNVTTYHYDAGGLLDTVTDANNHSILYAYDSRNRLITRTDQLGNSETYTYDTSDNLISVTDRKGQVTAFTYDLMDRVTRADYADGSYTTYTYDAGGRLTGLTDSISGPISYTYADTGCSTGTCGGTTTDKVASETTSLGAVSYAYDAIGRRTSMTVTGQPAVSYTYDANSRLQGVGTTLNGSPLNFAIGYDTDGRRLSGTYPNGVTSSLAYDDASHLTTLQYLDPLNAVLESLGYTYDANGNRISMDRQNVSLPPRPATTATAYNAANQLLTFNDKNITYDGNGNMTSLTNSCGTTNYTWNARNQLVGISGFDSACSPLTASFEYDGLGRRIEKTINGRTIDYLYDGMDIVQEIENGVPTVNYIRTLNIDEPLARIELATGKVRYYHTDGLGSIIGLTNESGQEVTQYAYDPFGNVTISGEASDNPFQYTGRENDGTGLYYYRARYYSPELQRFISEDPIGLAGGINQFAYVRNRPLNNNDPLGLFEVTHNIWTDYATYGANASEFQKERNFQHTAKLGKCFAICMIKGHKYSYPVVSKGIEQWITHIMEHHPNVWIRGAGEAIGWAGWIWFGVESYECLKECAKENECQ